ncbi:MAG: glycosyltransferase [Desulfobacteraceae bacterium]|jgi:glycosyltransferase involved in cell wall biosynthesis
MELAMAGVISALAGDRFSHSIACLKGEVEIRDALPGATPVYRFNSRPNEPRLPFRLRELVQKIRPDVIHCRNWGAWPDMALGRLFAWPVVPLIFSFHGLGEAGYMPWRRRFASRVLVHLTDHLFTVSRQSRELLVRHWGWPRRRTEVIPNGVDTGRFSPRQDTPSRERLVIGSLGNLRAVKNHALILKACAHLVEEGVDLEVRIAGEGDQRGPLRTLARSLGLEDHLHLLGGTRDAPAFLNGLDIFVLSSDSEQHPNALNEAMACGVASIGTRVGCVEDLLDGGRCGRIIEPGDVEGLAAALRDLSSDKALRRNLAHAGLAHVRAHYSLDVMTRRYRKLYLRAARGERA